jgi:neutral ceramidase
MRTLAAVIWVLGLAAAPAARGQLRAGAAAADITPQQWPVPMSGTFEFRPARSAHDPLQARALVLDDGSMKLAIVVIDNVGIHRELLDEAKRRASATTGIPVERMLMASTHTHSAPPARVEDIALRWPKESLPADSQATADYDAAVAASRAYVEYLTRQIAAAVEQAARRLEPAEIGWAVVELPEHLNNRRWFRKPGTIPPDPFGGTADQVQMNPPAGSADLIRPAGPVDPGLTVVSVRTRRGQPLAILANYSLHYVGGTPPEQVSADYFGEFARQIRERLGAGEEFVGILSNGTSGDVNNIDFRRPRPRKAPFEQIRVVAASVADKALEAYRTIRHRRDVALAMVERELSLELRKPTAAQLEFARAAVVAPDESKLPRNAKAYARRALAAAEGPATVSVKLQAIRIGELGITAIPFEVFAETGLEIKRRSPLKPSFTIELANGSYGYLPTPEQHALGGYETWLGTNRVEIQASRKITEALLEMLRAIARPRR